MKRTSPLWILLGLSLILPPAVPAQTSSTSSTAPQRTVHHHTDPALYHPASLTAKAPPVYEVKFITTKGDFVVQVTRAWAPLGADRFYNLVRHHFYDEASFFRVIPGFVVQFGLSPNPSITRIWEKANIADDPVTQSNRAGYVTFATAGPNTRTTQVFISLGSNAQLDSMGFAPFGQVTSGMDVVQQLYGGYGEGAPDGAGPAQDKIQAYGKEYLDKNFPKLDSIERAIIISPAPVEHHPATHRVAPAASTAPSSSKP
ncbi:MAG TPA: peptidylprolyl isomerase [Candidatus Acidoferrum sp.]|nr:peptidylprolyl isomerase [Candidatus Acidoferrum sp.]